MRTVDENSKKDWLFYRWKVDSLTRKVLRESNIQKPNDFCELDHKVSIKTCWENNIPAEVCASYVNLEYIPKEINRSKGKKCTMTLEELWESYFKSLE